MKVAIHKDRVKLYAGIGAGYLLFWLFQVLAEHRENLLARSINVTWLVCFLVVLNYILFEFTFPFFKLTWKRILLAPFLIWAHLMLHSFGLYAWRRVGIEVGIYSELLVHASVMKGVGYYVPHSFFSIIFFGLIKHIFDFRALKAATQQLRIEKQEAELNFLKSQTNPHFLFNTLNNIYALAREKSDLAPESILRLSKILRFMLYETSGDFIAIEQELKIMNDYIALEKLRYDESLSVNFNHHVEDMKQALPPLLLIPLVENAFKHGVSETRNRPFVSIHLSVKNKQLTFQVKNSTDTSAEEHPVKENIGLSNLRRQLELLYSQYELSVQQGDAVFTSTLTINLASHV